MNHALERLAAEVGLSDGDKQNLRLAFGQACALRVRHLLEEPAVLECLDQLGGYLEGRVDAAGLALARGEAARLANQHRGSKSIDGCGHAGVSATYAVANALDGRALQAASYAAYAVVYAGGGYAAVADRTAFEPEFSWQVDALAALACPSETSKSSNCDVRFVSATPVLASLDIERSVAFFCEKLGFSARFSQQGVYGVVVRGEVSIHLWACPERHIAENTSCRVQVAGVDALYAECRGLGIVHPKGKLAVQPWGSREFAILDPDGNLVTFSEPVGAEPFRASAIG